MYIHSFEGKTLLLRESVTMLKSKDVIHSESASFWCIIHVRVSLIILVLKKKALFFLLTVVYIINKKDDQKLASRAE